MSCEAVKAGLVPRSMQDFKKKKKKTFKAGF